MSNLPWSSKILSTNLQIIISDPDWKLGTNECMSTVNALSIWSDCSNYNTMEHMCDKWYNSKLPNQQQRVTQIAKRGVPQIDEHDVFDGLL